MKDRGKASIVRITLSGQYEGRFESVPEILASDAEFIPGAPRNERMAEMFEIDTKSHPFFDDSAVLGKKSLYHSGDRGERMNIRKKCGKRGIKLHGVLDRRRQSAHDYTNRGLL
jgi:hypothetical protein